jgi:hypothetical protein
VNQFGSIDNAPPYEKLKAMNYKAMLLKAYQ